MSWFKKYIPTEPTNEPQYTRPKRQSRDELIKGINLANFANQAAPSNGKLATTDSAMTALSGLGYGAGIPDDMLRWYGNQSFIGFQACMILAQHWLINAACEIPVKDALRSGYDISASDAINDDTLKKIKAFDRQMGLNAKLLNYGKFARVFGYRIAIVKIETDNKQHYEQPFNIDGVTKGSYKGIALVDPYYCTPQLGSNGFDPASLDFYEPEYWVIQGKRYHKSHCIIYRHCDVPALLRPAYLYGGVSLVQQIFEKVYSAEMAGNEANMLLMTKRLNVMQGDVEAAMMDQVAFEEKMEFFRTYRDNHGYQLIGTDDTIQQFETALAEVTNVIAQKYQMVAAVARMPTNILMQTPLEGFGSSGDSELKVYHGMLETWREECPTPLLYRHYECAIRSLGIAPFDFEIAWRPIESLSAVEKAGVNLTKAQTDDIYITNGSVLPEDINSKLRADKDSGYHDISDKVPDTTGYDDGAQNDFMV